MIKLFVVGFPREMDEQALHTYFSDFGDIHAVKIITDQETGQSKGYAFVDFLDEVGANLAIRDLDGSEMDGRTISVRVAEKQARTRKVVEIPVHEKTYEKVRQHAGKRQRRRLS